MNIDELTERANRQEPIVTQVQVTCYKFRYPKSSEWADITIDDSTKGVRVQIASDFGNWQYYWGAPGANFKKFLAGLNIEYAAGKFGADKWFDLEKTLEGLKTLIEENSPKIVMIDINCPNPECNDGEVEKETGGAGTCPMCGGNGTIEIPDEDHPDTKIRLKLNSEFNNLKNTRGKDEFISASCPAILNLCDNFHDYGPPLVFSIDPGFQQFWDKFWVKKFQSIMNS